LNRVRHRAEEQRVVEHMVIEGEGVAWHLGEPGGGELVELALLDIAPDREQLVAGNSTVPICLEGPLEFPVRPDSRVPRMLDP